MRITVSLLLPFLFVSMHSPCSTGIQITFLSTTVIQVIYSQVIISVPFKIGSYCPDNTELHYEFFWGRRAPGPGTVWGLTGWKAALQKRPLGSLWTPNWTRASNKLLQQRQPTASRAALGEPLLAGWRKGSFLSTQHWRDTSGMLGPALDSPLQETWTYWRQFNKET